MLTKSLHTVTAATNVAQLLLAQSPSHGRYHTPTGEYALAYDALAVLGYTIAIATVEATDPTVARIRVACRKLIDANRAKAAA